MSAANGSVKSEKTREPFSFSRSWLQGSRPGVSQKFSQDEPPTVGDIDWRATRRAVGPSIGRSSVD